MTRTLPTGGVAPIDVFATWDVDRALGYFEWDMPSSMTSASEAVYIKVTDGSAISSGYNRGLYIDYTCDGAKTGTGEINPLAVDMALTNNVAHAYIVSLYSCVTSAATPTVDYQAGIYYYMDATGSATVNEKWFLFLEGNDTNAATSDGYIRCYTGSTALYDTVLWMGAHAGCADYLLTFAGPSTEPCSVNASDSSTRTHRIAVKCGATVGYLSVFSS